MKMLTELLQTLVIIDKNKRAKNVLNKNICFILIYKKSILFSIFLLLICSSSVGCQEIISTSKQDKATNSTQSLDKANSFFPFGFYHVSWQTTPEQRLKALYRIAAAGFNTIHASIKSSDDLSDYGKFLDEAQKLGVKVITEFGVDRSIAINQFKNKPAVLGWNIADDVDNGKHNPEDVCQAYQQVKKLDPVHVAYISGFSNKIDIFANCSDVIGMQSYPIQFGTKWELPSTYPQISIASDVGKKFNKIIYANIQAFNWSIEKPENEEFKNTRSPSFNEVRNMTYQSLLSGVKGILYYAFQGDVWALQNDKVLWQNIKTLAPEIKRLSPILISGNFTRLSSGTEKILAGVWTDRKQAMIVVINTSEDNIKNATITLPISNIAHMTPMFAKRPSGMIFERGKLSGFIGSQEVHVYNVNL